MLSTDNNENQNCYIHYYIVCREKIFIIIQSYSFNMLYFYYLITIPYLHLSVFYDTIYDVVSHIIICECTYVQCNISSFSNQMIINYCTTCNSIRLLIMMILIVVKQINIHIICSENHQIKSETIHLQTNTHTNTTAEKLYQQKKNQGRD